MSRFLPLCGLLVALCLTGCKNDSESALSDVTDKQKEIVKVLKGVTDKSSAVAAKAKLQDIGKEMTELGAKMDKKKSNDAEMTKAVEKYKPEMEQAQKDIVAEMARIEKIPGAIQPVSEGLGSAMMGGFGNFMGGMGGFHP